MKKLLQKQEYSLFSRSFGGGRFARNLFETRIALLALAMIFVFASASCKSETAATRENLPTREITDDLNRRVKIPVKIERAVSLAPNLTEIVFAVGAGENLVGVTSYCDYPAEALAVRKVGDTINPNIETIIALRPQIVLVSTASQIETFTKQLEAQNIAVFVTNPNSLEDIYKSVLKIGDIFGKSAQAERIVADLTKRVDAIQMRTRNAERTKVFVQISKESLYTVGKDSFITDLIARAGGISATENIASAYPKISLETALALDPQAIILSESDDNREPHEVFKNSPAVKNNRVYKIDAALLSRPAPRIVDGLEQIAKSLHPESFR